MEPVSENERMEELFVRMGKRIRQLRKQKGYTSHETFALAHNISRSQYGRYERGVQMEFTTIVKITEALGVTLAEFFEGFETDKF